MSKSNARGAGFLCTNTNLEATWNQATIPAADLYSNWIAVQGHEGYVSFHYCVEGTDWVGVVRVQAHNDPDATNLDAVNVELSDGSTGVSVNTGAATASGFINVARNKAHYYRMFLDRTSGASTGNLVTCVVHQ
jgi:hypothetical protein